MRYVGLDVHKKVVAACILDAAGKVMRQERFGLTGETLALWGRRHLGADAQVALEATTHCWAIVEVLEPLCAQVVVSNPLRTKAIASAKVKCDRIDARVLAELLRADYLPRVWQPDRRTRNDRRLATRRATLSFDSTRVKNRLHAILHQRLIACPHPDLFGVSGRTWLQSLELDAPGQQERDSLLRLLVAIESEQEQMHQEVMKSGWQCPEVKLLMTLPGVDVTTAHGVWAALGSIERFPRADRVSAYLGLVPSTRQSAEHCYHGSITKQGASHARWLLIQAAQHVAKHPGPLGHFFRKLAAKKGRNIAVVATARKMAEIAWHLLRNNEPYRYAIPQVVEHKLSRLRVGATGLRRKTGPPQEAPRSAQYGTGQRTKARKSLAQVCAAENLPHPRTELPSAEARMLADQGLSDWFVELNRDGRIARRSSTASSA